MEFKRLSNKITSLSAKEAWAYKGTNRIEEDCMSPFVKDAIQDIAKIIGSDLDFVAEEHFISPEDGRYRTDLVFRESETDDDFVVIENQLGSTDHDHLGKCITYFTNIQAKKVVWISENFRPEHIKALNTLNEITSDEYAFYALEFHLMKLGDDPETYYEFKEIVCPTSVSKVQGQIRQVSSENREKLAYWESFFSELKVDLKKSHFNQGYTYHKIAIKKKICASLLFYYRNNDVCFQLSTEDDSSKENLQRIAEYLNSNFHYNFQYSVGPKNESLDKWGYVIKDFNYEPERKETFKQICININNVLEKSVE